MSLKDDELNILLMFQKEAERFKIH